MEIEQITTSSGSLDWYTTNRHSESPSDQGAHSSPWPNLQNLTDTAPPTPTGVADIKVNPVTFR